MRKTYTLALLTVILLSVLASTPAIALCYIDCGGGEECTGRYCCCIFDEFGTTAYCGNTVGPCGNSAAIPTEHDALQASYAAIFSATTPTEPQTTCESR